MFLGSLFTVLLLTTAAFAAPEGAIARRSRRSASRPSNHLQLASGNTGLTAVTNRSTVAYTPNWAGAVWNSYPSNTFNKVTGTFTVPTPSAPDGDATVWVGIDGSSCKPILQTGISITYKNGVISYDSWYEWLPDLAYRYKNPIAIRAGDHIRLTVTASSTTTGTTLIENLTTGLSESSPSLSYPSHPLCLQNAEWIVEDPSLVGGGMAPFCNFGTITFSSTSAYLLNGQVVSADGALAVDIKQNGNVLTSVSGGSPGTVMIKYV